jgi:L-aminopeptidase/D-esterase-like protein
VVLCESPDGAVVAADVRGGAPGTRDTQLAGPGMLVDRANAILLTGGSAYGLDAGGGVMRWLEVREIGWRTTNGVVPIVPAAVVFDLAVGDYQARPGAEAGAAACAAAERHGPQVLEGSVGAGTGCTVGKRYGLRHAMRGGQGTTSRRVGGRYTVGALMVVNAVGDVHDEATGEIVAGARQDGSGFFGSRAWLELGADPPPAELNTTIGVVATDAPLSKEQALRVAWMAQDGLARAVRPAHTMFDGDTLFVLSTAPRDGPAFAGNTRERAAFVSAIGAASAEAVTEAIVRAVRAAASLPGIPAVCDLPRR